MTINTYDIGDKVTITGTFTNSDTVTDPAAIHAHYRNPASVITDLVYGTDVELVKSSTGVYYFDILVTAHGNWHYRMDDNDSNVATEGYFQVRESNF